MALLLLDEFPAAPELLLYALRLALARSCVTCCELYELADGGLVSRPLTEPLEWRPLECIW